MWRSESLRGGSDRRHPHLVFRARGLGAGGRAVRWPSRSCHTLGTVLKCETEPPPVAAGVPGAPLPWLPHFERDVRASGLVSTDGTLDGWRRPPSGGSPPTRVMERGTLSLASDARCTS